MELFQRSANFAGISSVSRKKDTYLTTKKGTLTDGKNTSVSPEKTYYLMEMKAFQQIENSSNYLKKKNISF